MSKRRVDSQRVELADVFAAVMLAAGARMRPKCSFGEHLESLVSRPANVGHCSRRHGGSHRCERSSPWAGG